MLLVKRFYHSNREVTDHTSIINNKNKVGSTQETNHENVIETVKNLELLVTSLIWTKGKYALNTSVKKKPAQILSSYTKRLLDI